MSLAVSLAVDGDGVDSAKETQPTPAILRVESIDVNRRRHRWSRAPRQQQDENRGSLECHKCRVMECS